MTTLHDPAALAQLRTRLGSLRADSRPQWGRMSIGQMLWHINGAFEMALGTRPIARMRVPLPRPLMRFLVLELPWPKGAPTVPELAVAEDARHDFAAEHARALALLDEVAARPLDDTWPRHPGFGQMTGRHWSALTAKHLDHHLRQFGV